MKAGGAYVPADAGASVILTQQCFLARVEATGSIAIAVDAEDFGGEEDANLPIEVDPGSLVYAIYTSGSTGLPKGAGIPHGALANHMAWMRDAYPLDADDRV